LKFKLALFAVPHPPWVLFLENIIIKYRKLKSFGRDQKLVGEGSSLMAVTKRNTECDWKTFNLALIFKSYLV
jgi:hypothetical protein